MTKTIKLAISLIQNDLEYKELCKELFEMQYLSAKASNLIMTYLYADKQQEFLMKDEGMEVPNPKEIYGKSRMTYLYDKMSEMMTGFYSSNVSQTRAFVENQFSKDIKKGLLKGNISLTNFRRDGALYIHNKAYSIIKTEKGIGVKISLFNRVKSKELGLKNGQITFAFPHMSDGEKTTVLRMLSGDYKQGAGSLTYNKQKKKWMFAMSFTFTPEECTGCNTLIVSLSEKVLLTLSVRDSGTMEEKPMKWRDKNVPGLEELESNQQKFYALRKKYGNCSRIASDNKSGKGYKKRTERLAALGQKERNFRNTFNHKISRYVVDMAKRYDCGLIQLMDFSKTENALFQSWAYYDLQEKIAYKAKEKGIEIMEGASD